MPFIWLSSVCVESWGGEEKRSLPHKIQLRAEYIQEERGFGLE